ncbi:MAG: hypothetical protein ACYDGN_06905 [Acidimicrobiales bacterium]
MGDLPVDAQQIVDELRAVRKAHGAAPRSWTPSKSFDGYLAEPIRPPVHSNGHLAWMHKNWDIKVLLAPPPRRGVKGLVMRLQHKATMAVLRPYLLRLEDYLGVNTRAVDEVSRRVDELAERQQRMFCALRDDMIDFAHHVDDTLEQ